MFRLCDSVASIYLNQLNASGLIRVERHEIKVFYEDPYLTSVQSSNGGGMPNSEKFGRCLKEFLKNELSDGWEIDLMTILRGFSHFNRLAMLVRLVHGDATVNELKSSIGTCVKTLEHHLEFLHAADLVGVVGDMRQNCRIQLRLDVHPVARVLLQILREEAKDGIDYRNVVRAHVVDCATRKVIRRIECHEGNLGTKWMRKTKMRPLKSRLTEDAIKAMQEDDEEI